MAKRKDKAMFTEYHTVDLVDHVLATVRTKTATEASHYFFVPQKIDSTPAMLEYPSLVIRFSCSGSGDSYADLRSIITRHTEDLTAYSLQFEIFFKQGEVFFQLPLILHTAIAAIICSTRARSCSVSTPGPGAARAISLCIE